MFYSQRLVIILLIFAGNLIAQFQSNLFINQAYETNPFRLPVAQESWVSSFEGGLQYNFTAIALSYTGNYTTFSNFSDRNYYWHQFAVFSGGRQTRGGIYLEQRLNKSDYTVYDYTSLTAYINHHLGLGSYNIYLNANGIINQYKNIDEINNIEINTTARINKSFNSGTTFIAGLGYHYKNYTTPYSIIDSLSDSGDNQGNGPGTGNEEMQTIYRIVEVETPSISQYQYWFRIAQSLGTSTGVAAQYRSRASFNSGGLYIADLSFNYTGESEIFDDPMGYNLQSVGIELTQIFPSQIIFKASGYYGKKNYNIQGIYENEVTYNSDVLRADTYQTGQINLRKNISLGKTLLSIQLWYQIVNNSSNSFWYEYTTQYSSLSINLSF